MLQGQLLVPLKPDLGFPTLHRKRKTYPDEAKIMGTLGSLWHLSSDEEPDRRAERSWARFLTSRPLFPCPWIR